MSLDENETDRAGEVLHVKTMKPLLQKVAIGRVTLWTNFQSGFGEGIIEKQIYFNQEFCESGYTPTLGDEVVYEAIESQQGMSHISNVTWI